MNSILMESNSPTQQRSSDLKTYTSRKVKIKYEICDRSGYPYPCDLSYEIIEETKEVVEAKIEFYYGGPFEGTEETVKQEIQELEGAVDWMCVVEIE